MLPSEEEAAKVYKTIEDVHIPQVIQNLRRNADQYGGTFMTLGSKGQFADIWRKIGPLKRSLWDGIPLPREGPREICYDIIGHCLLTIALLDAESPHHHHFDSIQYRRDNP